MPVLVADPLVLALCHAGDPTANDDRMELGRAGLRLAGCPVLPDAILLDGATGTLWFLEIVVSGGEIPEGRRSDLLGWAGDHGFGSDRCRFVTIFRSRSEGILRTSIARLAWDSLVWLADEPDAPLRLDRPPSAGADEKGLGTMAP